MPDLLSIRCVGPWRFLAVSWAGAMNEPTDRLHATFPNHGSLIASEDRSLILWAGREWPEALSAECSSRGLRLLPISIEELERAAPHARVLVLEVPNGDKT